MKTDTPQREVEVSGVKAQTAVSILIVDDDSTKRFALKTILAPLVWT
jgi:hypothetical protein